MKTLEELQDLSLEELEARSAQEPVPVPEGLEARIAASLAARSFQWEQSAPKTADRTFPWLALAAAAVVAAVVMIPRLNQPRDTFSDPQLAYAEVEKAFHQISHKMAAGVDLALEAKPLAEKPLQVIEKINNR